MPFICSRLNNRFPSVACYLLSNYLCISHKVQSAVFLVTVVLLAIFRGLCEECSAILNCQVYFRNSTAHDHPPLDFSYSMKWLSRHIGEYIKIHNNNHSFNYTFYFSNTHIICAIKHFYHFLKSLCIKTHVLCRFFK